MINITASLTGGATTANVLNLGVYSRLAGGFCDLYLYSDNGGAPGTRLTFVLQAPLNAAGKNLGSPNVNTTVTAGQKYWIGGVCDNSPTFVEMYQSSISTETVYISPQSFGTALATTYPVSSANPTSGVGLTFYIQVQNAP